MTALPKEDGDYPLWLLLAVKHKLFTLIEDPEFEDARGILECIDMVLAERRPGCSEGEEK